MLAGLSWNGSLLWATRLVVEQHPEESTDFLCPASCYQNDLRRCDFLAELCSPSRVHDQRRAHLYPLGQFLKMGLFKGSDSNVKVTLSLPGQE